MARKASRDHYFTIWRKQPDGSWKWIFDAGCDVIDPSPLPADAAVPMLPVASSGAGSAKAAIDAVTAIEDKGPTDAAGAVGRLLARCPPMPESTALENVLRSVNPPPRT